MASNLATIEGRFAPRVRCIRSVPRCWCASRPRPITTARSGLGSRRHRPASLARPGRVAPGTPSRCGRVEHWEARIKFVSHPSFDDSTVAAEILGPMPGPDSGGKNPRKTKAPEDLPSFAAESQDSRFLTRGQEVHLFRKMNFLKYQAAQLQEAINPSQARSADLDRVEELLREAGAIRNRIIGSYLGLVVSIVKKCTGPCQDFFDMVSEGNVSLIQASERFDFGAEPGSARMRPGRS